MILWSAGISDRLCELDRHEVSDVHVDHDSPSGERDRNHHESRLPVDTCVTNPFEHVQTDPMIFGRAAGGRADAVRPVKRAF